MAEESLGIMIFIAYSQPDIAERFFAVAQNDRQADNIRPCLLNSFVLFARATISRPSDIQFIISPFCIWVYSHIIFKNNFKMQLISCCIAA